MEIQLPAPQGVVETRPTMKAEEVARALGMRSAASFYNRRGVLEKAGFPARLPGLNAWSRAAVLRWIATNGETFQPAEDPAANGLERRYAR